MKTRILHWLQVIAILLFMTLVAFGLLMKSKEFYDVSSTNFNEAIAKFLSGLASTVFTVGVLKFFLDVYQENKGEKEEKKAFRNILLNDLRGVVDEVELSKILIRSHQSAKTYGDCMRDKIMPSSIRLWDIKRSLVSQKDPFLGAETILDLRAHIHSMIAY